MEREKSILKQGAVQHLYGRLAGTLREDAGDAALLVHPFTQARNLYCLFCQITQVLVHSCGACLQPAYPLQYHRNLIRGLWRKHVGNTPSSSHDLP